MNYNILSYLIYSVIMIYIIIWVGKKFHQNGRIFIVQLYNGQIESVDTTNNLLLVAYYLFNMGYAILQFSSWPQVEDIATVISSVSKTSDLLILILALLHYNNMFIIYLLSKRKQKSIHI
ncbi:MAG: hypothetical protein DI598_12475 [Pseudopedobacter saltans]|uniref:Uncharacterized protein n=1 Tax=Pseudopedobacter saltans TaxID=151895 RepID=A0A2W5EUN7_9SPHI|nr:MAG: hypothetical protein DI598_12475 [Pseudopedobacter saltans]